MKEMEEQFIVVPISVFQALLQDIQSLKDQIKLLEGRQNEDIERLALDIAYDRQRLTKLEKVEPQPLQRDRADILRALIAANGGKILAKDARQKMHLSRSLFSMLLATVQEDIEVKTYSLKRNQKVLILK